MKIQAIIAKQTGPTPEGLFRMFMYPKPGVPIDIVDITFEQLAGMVGEETANTLREGNPNSETWYEVTAEFRDAQQCIVRTELEQAKEEVPA